MTTPPTPDAGAISDVLRTFGTSLCIGGQSCTHFDCVAEREMAAEIIRLTAQLAAAKADGERLDWIDKCDLDALHNTMGLIADGNGARYVIDNAIKIDAARTGAR